MSWEALNNKQHSKRRVGSPKMDLAGIASNGLVIASAVIMLNSMNGNSSEDKKGE